MESSPPRELTPARQVSPFMGGSPTISKDKYSKYESGINKISKINMISKPINTFLVKSRSILHNHLLKLCDHCTMIGG